MPTVCVASAAAGRGTGWTPMLERMGMTATRVVRPRPESPRTTQVRGTAPRMASLLAETGGEKALLAESRSQA